MRGECRRQVLRQLSPELFRNARQPPTRGPRSLRRPTAAGNEKKRRRGKIFAGEFSVHFIWAKSTPIHSWTPWAYPADPLWSRKPTRGSSEEAQGRSNGCQQPP